MSTYLPAHFAQQDLAEQQALIEAHPLATWASVCGGELTVNHVPMMLDRTRGPFGTLVGHVARANPVWRDPQRAIFVFQGAQAYVSPGWYPAKREHGKVVPTWNYAVVHAEGTPQVIEDPAALRAIVGRLTDRHEAAMPHPWAVADAPEDYIGKMLQAIVGIEVPVERLTGKWKVSQNRSAADREGVAAGLGEHPMAALVREGAAR